MIALPTPAEQSGDRYMRGSLLVLVCHGVILAVTFFVVCLFFVVGNTIYFDQQTFWLSFAWIASLAVMAGFAYWRGVHIIDMVLVWLYMFALPRLAQYLISPETVVLPVGEMTVDEVNAGLSGGLLLTVAFFAGISVIYLARPPKSGPRPPAMPLSVMLVLMAAYLGMLILETIVYSGMGASIYSLGLFEKADIPQGLKVLLTVVSADVFLFGIMYWFVTLRKTSWRGVTAWGALLIAVVAVLAYNYAGVLAGSRSSGFRILLYAAALGVVIGPRIPRSLARCAVLAAVAVVTSVLLVPLAHEARDRLIDGEATVSVGVGIEKAQGDPSAVDGRDSADETSIDAAMRIINRFGYLDYMVVAIAREPDATCRARYLDWSYYAQNVVNFLAPGDPYEDARLNTSNAFGICYRGVTEERMPAYHSEIWTLPGILALMFQGPLAVGVALAVGFAVAAISRALQQASGLNGTMVYIFWIYLFPFCVYFTMGVDHTVNTYITFALRLLGMVALVQLVVLLGRSGPPAAVGNASAGPVST